MSNEPYRVDPAQDPEYRVQPRTLSVVVTVTANGPPEDAEALAQAALKATRTLFPDVALGPSKPASE